MAIRADSTNLTAWLRVQAHWRVKMRRSRGFTCRNDNMSATSLIEEPEIDVQWP